MSDSRDDNQEIATKVMMEALIRFSLVAIVLVLCWQVFQPFLHIILWGLIMAIALYPVHQWLAKRMGGKQGWAATLMVLVAMLAFGIPLTMLASSGAEHAQKIHAAVEAGTLEVPAPKESVAEWPVIGEKVYTAWSAAAADFPKFLEDNGEAIKDLFGRALGAALGGLRSTLLMFGALIVAAILMTFATPGVTAMHHVFVRLSGPTTGPELQNLCTATVRSVTVGVLGVALIQAVLFGIGFVMIGMPAAGLLALVIMLLAIIQFPVTILGVLVVVLIWTKGDFPMAMSIFYSVFFLFAGLSDNVLKPLLLGRGVPAPMPVILLGALGGMVSAGFIGLFIGAVVLAVGYVIFTGWVNNTLDGSAAGNTAPADAE